MSSIASETRKRNQLERFLSAWDLRLRLTQSVIWLPRGLAAGLLAAILVLVAARFWPLLPTRILIPLSIVLGLLGVIGSLLGVWLWQRSPLQQARRFDRVFGLKERMSAAIEIGDGSIPAESDDIATRQLDQALRVAGQVRPSELLPFRADWREWTAPLAAIALVVTALVLPNPQDQVIAQ